MAEAFRRGDVGAIWAEMTPEMQAAIGSEAAFGQVRADLRPFGEEAAVVSERVTREGAFAVYERVGAVDGGSGAAADPGELRRRRAGGRVLGAVPAGGGGEPVLDYRTKAALRLPFDGAWRVYWGGRTIEENYHAADAGQRSSRSISWSRRRARAMPGDAVGSRELPVLGPAESSRRRRGVAVAGGGDRLPDQAIGATRSAKPGGQPRA